MATFADVLMLTGLNVTGSVTLFSLLDQTTHWLLTTDIDGGLALFLLTPKLSAGESIGNMGGSWWFIQLWLNLYTHQAMGRVLKESCLPSSDFAKEEEGETHRCMSFGEATSAFSAVGADIAWIFKSQPWIYQGNYHMVRL